MSRLEELIQELCPDGVEYKSIDEIFNLKNGYTPSTSNPSYWEGGKIPWFRMEDIRIQGRVLSDSIQHITPDAVKGNLFPANSIILATSATIGEHALITVEALANQRFTCLSRKPEYCDKLNMRFFYHFCFILDEWCLNNVTLGNFLTVDMGKLRKFSIPLPPLPVQEEIVRILDKFTALEAELEAELEARKKQYSFIKSRLLVFGSNHLFKNMLAELCPDGLEERKLGDVIRFENGRAYKQEEMLLEGKYQILRFGNFYSNNSWYFSDLELPEEKYCYCGDLLYSWAATLGPHIWNGKKAIYHYHIWKLHFDENLLCKKYLYYFLQVDVNSIQDSTTESTMLHVSMKNMSERIIPLPPMQIQARIVSILDRFDALVNDITQGLPAELAARRRQYEYYRDKLLTFKEKVS